MKKNLTTIFLLITIAFCIVYGLNIFYLIEIITTTNESIYKSKYSQNMNNYNKMSYLQEKALWIRYNRTKKEEDLIFLIDKANWSINESQDYRLVLTKISAIGVKNYPQNDMWTLYENIAKISLNKEVSLNEQEKIITAIINRKINSIVIQKAICYYKLYNKNTYFLSRIPTKNYSVSIPKYSCNFPNK